MATKLAERVKDTAASITGTGSYTLNNAPPTGFQSFNAGVGDGASTIYCATDGTNWEVVRGVYTNGTLALTRDTVIESSNSGSKISWSAATPTIFVVDTGELATGSIFHPGYQASRAYPSFVHFVFGAASTVTLTNSRTWWVPFYVGDWMNAQSININITTAGVGGTPIVRLGIYTCKDGLPDKLVVDAGSFSVTTTGVKTASTGMPIRLAPGWYFVCVAASVVSTTNAVCTGAAAAGASLAQGWFWGLDAAFSDVNTLSYALIVSTDYSAALPATYPGSGSRNSITPLVEIST